MEPEEQQKCSSFIEIHAALSPRGEKKYYFLNHGTSSDENLTLAGSRTVLQDISNYQASAARLQKMMFPVFLRCDLRHGCALTCESVLSGMDIA